MQLKTRTKMFCRCAAGYGAGENTQTCPVCLGFPGALPVMNRTAIEWTVKLGLALGCEIAPRAVFARKNYFYPDLPKGYQISQYDLPSCENGSMVVPLPEGELTVGIVRAHLEEDAAKTVHMGGHSGRIGGAEYSLVDYNRGGTPLLEIVTAPDIHSSEEAKRFLLLLRQTVVELGISDAEMEKGTLRVDANVSVRPEGSDELRTRCEIKNMNSFNYIARGIEAEAARQIAIWEAGGEVKQETFDFDAGSGTLTPRRSKEEADDYRYFPEPDLIPVAPPAEMIERLRAELSEPPAERVVRLGKELDLERALVLVTGGLDEPLRGHRGSGRRPHRGLERDREQPRRRRRRPCDRRRRRAREARLCPRADPARRLRRGNRQVGRSRLLRRSVPRAGGRQRRFRARPGDRRDHRGQSRTGCGVQRRQGGPARVLRRSGDEGDGRPGRPAGRERDRARETTRLSNTTHGII